MEVMHVHYSIFSGLQFKTQDFSSPLYSTSLPPQQKTAIAKAVVDGDTLHDCVCEGQAIYLDVEDAFENSEEELELAAYDEKQCHICPSQELDNLVAQCLHRVKLETPKQVQWWLMDVPLQC